MLLPSWLTFRRPAPARRRLSRSKPTRRLALEALEGRCLLSAGALDPTFGNGAGYVTTSISQYNDSAASVLIQPDGKILAAGSDGLKADGSRADMAVVRYNTTGSLDTSFGSGGTALADFGSSTSAGSLASAIYPQAGTANDGKIVLAGSDFNTRTGQYFFALSRFNSNGTLDASFGTNTKAPGEVTLPTLTNARAGFNAVVIQPDGKIVAAGGDSGFELVRYNVNGTLDTSFGSGGKVLTPLGTSAFAHALLLQPDGKLVATGFANLSSGSSWEMARYNADGSLDTSFGNGGVVSGPFTNAASRAAALYPSGTSNAGKILVVGSQGSKYPTVMARYNADGSLDPTFGTGGQVTSTGLLAPSSVEIASDGKLVLAGRIVGLSKFAVSRYNADGTPDTSFGTGGFVTTVVGNTSAAYGMVLQPDGEIVVAGYADMGTSTSTKYNFLVARYLPSEPEIGSMTASANPVTAGSSETLTASNITDANPGATITQVTFYYIDSNGNQVSLGTGTQTSPGVWSLNFTVNLASGTYTIYAQAEDSYGVFGDPFALTLTVQ